MSYFTDGVRGGKAGYPGADSRIPPAGAAGQGAGFSNVIIYSVVPATMQLDNIGPLQIASGAPATLTVTAGTGTTLTSINGVTYVDLGVARAFRASGGSTAAATTIVLYGLDDWLQPMSEQLTGPGNSALTTATKAFRYVASGTASGNSTYPLAGIDAMSLTDQLALADTLAKDEQLPTVVTFWLGELEADLLRGEPVDASIALGQVLQDRLRSNANRRIVLESWFVNRYAHKSHRS